MQPIHPEVQQLLAAEHIESLNQSWTSGRGAGTRVRVGRWLVRAGLRLTPELTQRGERSYRARPALR
jgi:hypothetical protein